MTHDFKERPISFSGKMVRAILEGRKTQTRRVVKDLSGAEYNDFASWDRNPDVIDKMRKNGLFGFTGKIYDDGNIGSPFAMYCPFGKVGDRLWVRETYQIDGNLDHLPSSKCEGSVVWYQDGCSAERHMSCPGKTRQSIFMPRWASRITLEITGVRVERLNDISEEDARAEGAPFDMGGNTVPTSVGINGCGVGWNSCKNWFTDLWENINGQGSWAKNQWVWVVEFRKIEKAGAK